MPHLFQLVHLRDKSLNKSLACEASLPTPHSLALDQITLAKASKDWSRVHFLKQLGGQRPLAAPSSGLAFMRPSVRTSRTPLPLGVRTLPVRSYAQIPCGHL